MRAPIPAAIAAAALLAALLTPSAVGSSSPAVIQYWYSWGKQNITGSNVWSYAATNLTMSVQVSEQNGSRVEEINDLHVLVLAPGQDPVPPSNRSIPAPRPMISAAYDTVQVIRNPDYCVPSNSSVGFTCGVANATWRHQVLEIRFLRLIEFSDTNGDGGYQAGETVVSQLDLSDRAFRYDPVSLTGLNATTTPRPLPTRAYHPDICCGESSEGWIGQNESGFRDFDGVTFRLAATGPANVTVAGFQWFAPRMFQGVNLTPFQGKLDLTIESYPFLDAGSRLAFELNVTAFSQGSATNWEVVPWPDGQGIGADSANTTAIFAWSSSATADGISTPVAGTVASEGALSRHVFLGYPRADLIQHDPLFGISDKRLGDAVVVPPPGLVSAALIAFVATLVGASVFLYATERRKG